MGRIDILMPQMGESIAEGTVSKWLKKVGDAVKRDESLFEISTDKVDAEIPSPAAGVLAEIKVQEGQTVPVNTVVAQIEAGASAAAGAGAAKTQPPAAPSASPAPAPAAAAPPPAAPPGAAARPAPVAPQAAPAAAYAGAPGGAIPRAADMAKAGASVEEMRRVRSSPVVRKIAQEHNLDISRIPGSGIGGRVSKKDIMA